jgi:hypothetical protein
MCCGRGNRWSRLCLRRCRHSSHRRRGSRRLRRDNARCRRRTHPRRFRRRILRVFFRFSLRFRLCFRVRYTLKMFAHLLRDIRGNGAGVRLLFRDAIPGQQVNNRFRLDLQLAGQLINANLVYV